MEAGGGGGGDGGEPGWWQERCWVSTGANHLLVAPGVTGVSMLISPAISVISYQCSGSQQQPPRRFNLQQRLYQ